MTEGQIKEPPALPVYYMRMTQPNVDARLGKLREGQVVPMDQARATRYLSAGVAVQVSKGEYDEHVDRRQQKATAQQNAFRALNDGAAVWDVATYRDVLTAPEKGLRLAVERGIPLVNVHMLRDEDGDPLAPDADIEDILDARELMHPDLVAPLAAHDRSSVMGGGSPYVSNVNPGGASPMPLSPQHRAMAERIAQQEQYAQQPAAFSYDRNDPAAKKEAARAAQGGERATRASRRAAPKPMISPQAEGAAQDAGVVAPSNELTSEQQA
jgi:hypothetical protein